MNDLDPKESLTLQKAAAILKLPTYVLIKMTIKGTIPCFRDPLTGKRRFRLSDLLDYYDTHRIGNKAEY